MRKSGLADSPFFRLTPPATPPTGNSQVVFASEIQDSKPKEKSNFQSSRDTEIQTPRLPDTQTSRLPDFETYEVPDYRKMQRIEVRLTWEQNKYLDDLEAIISRDTPEGDKSDPGYRRITKNSIIRVLVEITKRLNIQIDARNFRSEKNLLKTMRNELKNRISKLPDSETSRVPD